MLSDRMDLPIDGPLVKPIMTIGELTVRLWRTEVLKLEEALRDIAQGNANLPDTVLMEGRAAVTSHMWTYSQERAREALDGSS